MSEKIKYLPPRGATERERDFAINRMAKMLNEALPAANISYDPTESGLPATDVQAAIDELAARPVAGAAEDITYDPTDSGLSATDVQGAVDELAGLPFYLPSNILGTVSQAGGVPTGAIIERGSNANGEYVRFADGTQICRKSFTGLGPISTAWGTLFTASAAINGGSYATSFVEAPNVMASAGSTGAFAAFTAQIQPPTDSAFGTFHLVRGTSSSGTNFFLNLTAIGRWF